MESRNITRIADEGPIFWERAEGAVVEDVDGNRFLDLTAGFGVAAAGHGSRGVAGAVARQAERLAHAMGDVHPAAVKVELLERLAALAPGGLDVSILSANGGDAVESALKTALMATGRPGLIAFENGYHGLGYGALAVTGLEPFRAPFRRQLYGGVRFAPFPATEEESAASLDAVRARVLESPSTADPVGAVIVEPIQGRGGIVVPPDGFLRSLRDLCTELDVLLILDEVYTGFGRTGRWFACEHEEVVPDLLVVGKALAGGLPLSAVIGTAEVMAGWPPSEGEALHTSTFLGNPVTAAAALANLHEIEERGLVGRAHRLGAWLEGRIEELAGDRAWGAGSRGRGLMRALVVSGPDPAAHAALAAEEALRRGVIVLPEGDALALTPPLVVTRPQLDHALDVLVRALDATMP